MRNSEYTTTIPIYVLQDCKTIFEKRVVRLLIFYIAFSSARKANLSFCIAANGIMEEHPGLRRSTVDSL